MTKLLMLILTIAVAYQAWQISLLRKEVAALVKAERVAVEVEDQSAPLMKWAADKLRAAGRASSLGEAEKARKQIGEVAGRLAEEAKKKAAKKALAGPEKKYNPEDPSSLPHN